MNTNKEESEDKQAKTTDCSGHVEPVVMLRDRLNKMQLVDGVRAIGLFPSKEKDINILAENILKMLDANTIRDNEIF